MGYIHKLQAPEEALADAIKAHNTFRADRSGEGFPYEPATLDSGKFFLQCITKSYLRHRCSAYERMVDAFGGRLQVYVDGVRVCDKDDAVLPQGKIGLYCWGNPGAQFDEVVVLSPSL